jgi:hypothetical protein
MSPEATRWSGIRWTAAAGIVSLLATVRARAEGTVQAEAAHDPASERTLSCARSLEQSQRLLNGSHYVAASSEATKGASPSCGEALFDECRKICDELQRATPSVLFAVRDSAGHELSDVTVVVDGESNSAKIDGKPIRVDPGNHEFSFSSIGYMATRQVFLIRAGEQFREFSVVLLRARVAPGVEPPAMAHTVSDNGAATAPPLASYVLGGFGVLGLAAFVGFRVAGSSNFDELSRDCKPACSVSAVDTVRHEYLISYLGLGVGAAAAAGALTIYFTAPRSKANQTTLLVSPMADGLGARVAAHF